MRHFPAHPSNIILASSSAYRKKLLKPLLPSVTCISPCVDESIHPGESAAQYVKRLALDKATAVSRSKRRAWIIAADQCAELQGKIITKPANPEEARDQLRSASDREVKFYTGLCLLDSVTNEHQLACETYEVKFRKLTEDQIDAYLQRDEPYDCAGSFKAEGLGITLFERMRGDDPNTLIGLPLIRLTSMLKDNGMDLLTHPACKPSD